MSLIPRLAEALDAELIRQKLVSQWVIDLDPESLAVAAWESCADQLEGWGFVSAARHIRHDLVRMTR